MSKLRLLIICISVLVLPSLAQNSLVHKTCSPAGTWYGGSDYKYLTTITPIEGNTFAIRGEAVYSQGAWGYTGWTSWSGELVKTKDGRYVDHSISMYTTSFEMQPPVGSFELDAVRGWMEFLNCDTIQFTYDFFGAYFDLNKLPFVDLPDLNYLPPGGITESYSRMRTKCPACEVPVADGKQPRQRH